MLSAQQVDDLLNGTSGSAEGGGGEGSILEEQLDSLLLMSFEARRYVCLLRELDTRAEMDLMHIRQLQSSLLKEIEARLADKPTSHLKALEMEKIRGEKQFQELIRLRTGLSQKIGEKTSIAEQLLDIGGHALSRLKSDVAYAESLFRKSEEYPGTGYTKGTLVAALVEDNGVWILAKVVEAPPLQTGTILVADIEDMSSKYNLPFNKVKRLPIEETLHSAKTRLNTRGRKVYAMYPDTTSFYKGTLTGLPTKDNTNGINSNGFFQIGQTEAFGIPSQATNPAICQVMFDDDSDAITGQTSKYHLPTRFVFLVE